MFVFINATAQSEISFRNGLLKEVADLKSQKDWLIVKDGINLSPDS